MDASVAASVLEQLPDVDPSFLKQHGSAFVEALGSVPGVDSVRAVAIRHIDALEPADRSGALQGAARALRAYPDAVAEADPLQLMTRHPAWVGLCHLELADALDGDRAAALEVAVAHACLGFGATVGQQVAPGDAAWAMAEIAEDAGWEDRAQTLLELSLGLEWSEEEGLQQVRLLLGERFATSDPTRATMLLEAAVEGSSAHTIQVQAAFVLSRISEAQQDLKATRQWIERALSLVHPDDDPSVRESLEVELKRVGFAP